VAPTSNARATTPPEPVDAGNGSAAAATLFSADYATARERFLAAAKQASAAVDTLSINARGPHHEELGIDFAWLGVADARRVLLHVSGVHGVEAYAGSATQLGLLQAPPPLPPDGAIVLVHVLNPYGMAWLRRANECNVDLNRNFLRDGATWSGAPPLYRRLDALLNPPSPPTRDAFALRIGLQGLRHGVAAVRQAIAHGQHRYPRGLFYGGAEPQQGTGLFCEWLRSRLNGATSVFAIDMHTGLGAHGRNTLITEPGVAATPAATPALVPGPPLAGDAATPAAYGVRGSLGAALPRLLPGRSIHFLLQEIGTWPPLQVLHALREENRWHHHGAGHLDHPAKRRLLEALCPASTAWRRAAVAHGCNLVYRAAGWLFRSEGA
jgi:hypothetical protein